MVVFTLMTALFCAIAYGVVRHPRFGERMQKVCAVALPFVLIALGVHILLGARVLVG